MSAQLAFATPLALAMLGAVLSLAADAFDRDRLALAASALGLGLAAVVAGIAAATVAPSAVWTVFRAGAGFSMAMGVVLGLGALSLIASVRAPRERSAAIGGLVAISAAALAALAATTDIIAMLLTLETAALAGYALVTLSHTARAQEAAMKYFVQGAVATAFFVFGLAGAMASGALAFDGGRLAFGPEILDVAAATTAIVLVLAAFAFKLSAFPFHSWAPDAYETAPPEAAAFLSSGVKVAALVAMYSVTASFMMQPDLADRLRWLVAGTAAASIVFGNLAALAQRSYPRLLAYSGIAQVGYGLIALTVANGSAALMFVSAYGCAAAGAFAAARAYGNLEPEWDGSIASMAGLSRRSPILAASLAVLLFSLTGIPPLFGFWGKFLVFLSAATNSQWLWLVILGLLGSVVSFGYYGRVLRAVYFDDAPEQVGEGSAAVAEGSSVPESASSVHPAATGAAGRAKLDPATGVALALALVMALAGIVPLVAGLARFVGLDPAGLFVIGL